MLKQEAFEIIQQAYDEHRMFESILFVSSSQDELFSVASATSRFLYCENHSFNDDGCDQCQKFDDKRILDYKIIGDGVNLITKDALKNPLTDFLETAKVAGNPKVLVLANAENLKVEAANSLLKFLEEPTKNTFLFLLSKNKNSVLPTIRSRTKIFTLNQSDEQVEDNFLVQAISNHSYETILLLNRKLKKLEKTELLVMLHEALPNILKQLDVKTYELTLTLIDDLTYGPNDGLAIDNYLIQVGANRWKPNKNF